MKCELCPRKAKHRERRGFYIRYMCGDCYALPDDEFHRRDSRRERNLTKQTEPDREERVVEGIPESQLALF